MSEKQNPSASENPKQSKNSARQFSTLRYETRPELIALLQSEDGARRILGRILSDNFDYFAIRYVNIKQYEEYLQAGYSAEQFSVTAAAGEANGFYGQSFREFFREHSAHWEKSVEEQTDWAVATVGMKSNNEFTALLKECKKEAHVGTKNQESVREKTMVLLQEKIIAQIDEGIKNSSGFFKDPREAKYSAFARVLKLHRTPSLDTLQETYGKNGWSDRRLTDSQIEAMYRFFNTPAAMHAQDVRKLREIIVDTSTSDLGMRGDQYHLALLFDPKVLKVGKDNHHWGLPRAGKGWWSDMQGRPEEEILAAIPLLNDRKLTEKVMELSRASGKLAHPVIDRKGFVRYPDAKMNILAIE